MSRSRTVRIAYSLMIAALLLAVSTLAGATGQAASPPHSALATGVVIQPAPASHTQVDRRPAVTSANARPDPGYYHRLLGFQKGRPNPPASSASHLSRPGQSLPHPAMPSVPDSSWGLVPTPATGPASSSLQGISVLAPFYAWAVGSYGDAATLTEFWNGTNWAVVPSPNAATYNYLTAVGSTDVNDVYAVGYDYNANATASSLILHWNGASWIQVTGLPNVNGALDSVKVISDNDVWAVGSYLNGTHVQPLTLHYNGSAWSMVGVPPAGLDASLFAISAGASNDVWAAGSYYNDGDPFDSVGFTAHWNGISWAIIPTPASWQFTAIASSDPNNTWVFGDSSSDPFNDVELILHWNGSSWTRQSAPASANIYQLFSATAVSGIEVWAVGHVNGQPIRIHTVNAGASWTIVNGPSSAGDLTAVSGSAPNNVLTVGCSTDCYHTKVELWNGAAWDSVANYPQVGHADASIFDSVALDASHAWAVGMFSDNQPLLYSWDGSAWSAVANLPLPPGQIGGWLESISAPSANDIWVAGFYYASDGANRSLVLHFDGSSWTFVPIRNQDFSATESISALSPTDVWAEDTSELLHFNGSSWTTSYNNFSVFMNKVAARATNDVWALGDDVSGNTRHQTIIHNIGGGWQSVPPPTLSGNIYLYAILPLPNEAWAVGDLCGTSTCQALTLHWTSATNTWAVVDSGSRYGAYFSISANSPSSIWLSGYSRQFSTSFILNWNGVSWVASDPIALGADSVFGPVAAYGAANAWAFGDYRDDASFSYPAFIEVHPAFATPTPTITPTPTNTPSPTPTLAPYEFYDVPPGSIWHDYVHWLAQHGIVSGTSPGYYSPNANTTRAQFAKMITLGFGYPLTTPTTPSFTDVPPSNFAYAFIETAHAQGVISGYSASQCQAEGRIYPCFGPNDNISRAQLVVIAVRAKGWAFVTPSTPTFSDVPVGAFAYAQIETAVSKGVINGFTDNSSYHICADAGVASPCFRPNNNGTRGQLAKILYLTINTAADTPTPTPPATDTPLPPTDTPVITATATLTITDTPAATATVTNTPLPTFSPTPTLTPTP